MNELNEIQSQIEQTYMSNLPNDWKYNKVSILWEKYYFIRKQKAISSDSDLYFRLIFENECYRVNQNPNMIEPDLNKVKQSLLHLKIAKENGGGITESEARCLLEYVIYHTRKQFTMLGILVDTNSLNGFVS